LFREPNVSNGQVAREKGKNGGQELTKGWEGKEAKEK